MATVTMTRLFIGGEWRTRVAAHARGDQPGDRRGARGVAQGDREDARRAVAAARAAFPAGRARTAFERAARCSAIADVCERRRDELARALTLDQGKPLYAEAYERGRRARRDVARRGRGRDPDRGHDPAELHARRARAAAAPAARGRSRSSRRGTGRTRCRPSWWRRRSRPATPSSGTPRRARRSAPACWPSASPRPTCPPGVFNFVPGQGPVVGDEIVAHPGTSPPSASSARRRPATRSPSAPPARRCCWRWAATARSSCSTTPTSTPRPTRAISACFLCAGQSCTAGERLLVHERGARGVRRRLAERRSSREVAARRPARRGHADGPAQQRAAWRRRWTSTCATRSSAAPRSSPAASARAASRPTSTGRRRSSTASRPTPMAATEETFGPIAPIVAIGSLERGDRADQRVALRAAGGDLHRRPAQGPALRRRGAQGPREHQRDDELLGEPPAVRRPRGHRQRQRPRRRPLPVRRR